VKTSTRPNDPSEAAGGGAEEEEAPNAGCAKEWEDLEKALKLLVVEVAAVAALPPLTATVDAARPRAPDGPPGEDTIQREGYREWEPERDAAAAATEAAVARFAEVEARAPVSAAMAVAATTAVLAAVDAVRPSNA
jgi:hypothetical protein